MQTADNGSITSLTSTLPWRRHLHDCIAPRCYGAFEGDGVVVPVLDLYDGILNEWGELSDRE